MPNQPLRPCSSRCATLTRGGRCDACQSKYHKAIDARRGSSTQRGYNTARWQRYRISWLVRHSLCGSRYEGMSAEHSRCWARQTPTPATQVDHIIPVTGPEDPAFWKPRNHQSLCHRCHSAKTMSELNARRVAP